MTLLSEARCSAKVWQGIRYYPCGKKASTVRGYCLRHDPEYQEALRAAKQAVRDAQLLFEAAEKDVRLQEKKVIELLLKEPLATLDALPRLERSVNRLHELMAKREAAATARDIAQERKEKA